MPKDDFPKSQKPQSSTSKTNETKKSGANDQMVAPKVQTSTPSPANKGKHKSGRSNRPRYGGTAVTGAKSTQPREIHTNNPQQQQTESYNRDMRRRMEHLGTAPGQASSVQNQRRKRLEKRQKRIEERNQEVKKVAARGPRQISLGRKNTYFLIAMVVVIIAIILLAIIINHRL